MWKTLDVLLVVAMLGGASWTFAQKYGAEAIELEVMLLDRKIALERETLQLLQADWSLLNQPVRLEKLARAFDADLKLVPVQPQQIVEPNGLPSAPIAEPEEKSATLASAASRKGTVR